MINNIGIKKIVASNKVPFGKKILNILFVTKMLKRLDFYAYSFPKMSAYRRNFDETKYIPFLIKYDELLKQYDQI